LRRSLHLPVFYSAHQGSATFTGMTSKWECNVQNNRAYQYDMIWDEIFDWASTNGIDKYAREA